MLTAVAVVAALIGASVTVLAQRDDGRPALTPPGPCVEPWGHQQVAARFASTTDAARALEASPFLLGVGTLDDGLCLWTDTGLHHRGWTVSSITLTATGHGEDGLPVTFTRTGTDRSEDLNLLYVPLTGCVQVHGVVTATRAGTRSGRPDDVARWTATRMYGRDCAKAPNHGAWQGDDGMLVRR